MGKIIQQAGAIRVSDSAKTALAEMLSDKGIELSREAIKLAEHAGRRTVTDKDIRLAAKS
jgi:histone H3/H4